MHVFVTADTVGGVWTYTRELVSGLLCRGHRVTLVSLGRLPRADQASWIKHERLSYYPTDFPLEWMQHSEAGIRESAKFVQRTIQQSQPDVVHFSQFCYGGLECAAPKIVVAHSDVLSWWNEVHGTQPQPSAWFEWYKTIVSRGLRCADAVVAPSCWMLHALHEHYEPAFRGCVIYNGRSPSRFAPSDTKKPCVLSVGRVWDEAKQIRLLLVRKQTVPVKVAGSVQHPDRTASEPDWKSSDDLEFYGEQDERHLRTLYSSSAIYAATSRYEPFGLAPVEAALSGCAVVANDIPTFRELWQDAAYYFPRNDPDGLAHAIAALAKDAAMRDYFAAQARECAQTKFSSQRMVSEYENLYRELIQERAGV